MKVVTIAALIFSIGLLFIGDYIGSLDDYRYDQQQSNIEAKSRPR